MSFTTTATTLVFFLVAASVHTTGVNAKPSNDVTLYTRALFQDCEDSNRDTLAVNFLEGTEKWIASHKSTRDAARNALSKASDHNVVYFSSRTNYIDDKINEWTNKDPTIKQIVIVAAGYDSRAYRLALPKVKFFEVDFPAVMEEKAKKVQENKLTPTGESVVYVGADLRNTTLQDALEGTKIFDKTERTIFVVEGLVYYLVQSDVDKLLYSISLIAEEGSKIVLDFTNECIIEQNCEDLNPALIKIFLTIVKLKKEMWFSGFPKGAIVDYLKRWGFETDELLSFQNASEPPLNLKTWTNSTIFGQMNFVSATKTRNMPYYESYFI